MTNTGNEKYNSEKFISNLTNLLNLKENDLYSDDEYSKRKVAVIVELIEKGISQNLEDFLSDILILKEKGILNIAELKKIKQYLSPVEDSWIPKAEDSWIPKAEDSSVSNAEDSWIPKAEDSSDSSTDDSWIPRSGDQPLHDNDYQENQTITMQSSSIKNKTNKRYPKIIIGILGIIALGILINYIVYLNINSNNKSTNYTPTSTTPEKKLTKEEIKRKAQEEANEQWTRDHESSNKKLREESDRRQREIDKMSPVDYYIYKGNPNNLDFNEIEKERNNFKEDYWKGRKK